MFAGRRGKFGGRPGWKIFYWTFFGHGRIHSLHVYLRDSEQEISRTNGRKRSSCDQFWIFIGLHTRKLYQLAGKSRFCQYRLFHGVVLSTTECTFCNIKCVFQTTALVSSIFPLLAFFGIFIIPESPAWLVRQKQDFHGAKKSLSRLHRSPLQFAEEVR